MDASRGRGHLVVPLIGNMVRYLAEHPETARVLRETPELIPRFVEEVGRLDPPFNFHYRLVKRNCELAGFDLHPGDRLMLLWASANRDPAHLDDPAELRLDRKRSEDHMTFGRGGHFCFGAPIARLEGRIVCEELLRATESIALRPGHAPVYANSIMVRRLEHLLLDAEPASMGSDIVNCGGDFAIRQVHIQGSGMTTYDHVIVGSGINALVCAGVLATRGRRVCVLERNDRLGGCIRTEEATVPGFTHDVLSGWHPLFVGSPGYAELKQRLEENGLEYCNADYPTGVVLPDDRFFIWRSSREANAEAMERVARGDGERYRRSMAELDATLELTSTLLGSELRTAATARTFARALWRMGPLGLADYFGATLQNARSWLEATFSAEETRAILAPWPSHAGMSLDSAASGQIARVMAFSLETVGCPVVKGGSYKLVEAFQRIIEAHGGELHAGADVERVLTENGRAIGVRTAGGASYRAQGSVICSTTPHQLYERLLEAGDVPHKVLAEVRGFRYGRSDMQIHLALDEPPQWVDPDLARVAIVHLTPGLNGVSKAINEAERGLIPETATIAVGQPTALDPSRAPRGKAILWLQLQELPAVMRGDAAGEIPVPGDGRWSEEVRERYADRIVARVGKHIKNLEGNILGRRVLSPADLESLNINLVGGDPYGGACTLDQLFLWRPLRSVKNHSTPVRDLYHIGASTHPGPGLGGVSGFLVANALA